MTCPVSPLQTSEPLLEITLNVLPIVKNVNPGAVLSTTPPSKANLSRLIFSRLSRAVVTLRRELTTFIPTGCETVLFVRTSGTRQWSWLRLPRPLPQFFIRLGMNMTSAPPYSGSPWHLSMTVFTMSLAQVKVPRCPLPNSRQGILKGLRSSEARNTSSTGCPLPRRVPTLLTTPVVRTRLGIFYPSSPLLTGKPVLETTRRQFREIRQECTP